METEAQLQHQIRCAWGKFSELSSFLTRRNVSLRLKGRVYAV